MNVQQLNARLIDHTRRVQEYDARHERFEQHSDVLPPEVHNRELAYLQRAGHELDMEGEQLNAARAQIIGKQQAAARKAADPGMSARAKTGLWALGLMVFGVIIGGMMGHPIGLGLLIMGIAIFVVWIIMCVAGLGKAVAGVGQGHGGGGDIVHQATVAGHQQAAVLAEQAADHQASLAEQQAAFEAEMAEHQAMLDARMRQEASTRNAQHGGEVWR